jgi:uncharacterized protein (DUF169 family)
LTSTTGLAQRLTDALHLNVSPVAITFSDEPQNAQPPSTPVPAGCSFWELGAKATVTTTAPDHQFCSIGVHTHNLANAVASHGSELETALGAMTGLGYVKANEVAAIPVMNKSHSHVTYRPLADTTGPISVVLIVADAAQSLTLTEAAARVDGASPPAMGRPACALIPQVVNSGTAAASLGCCGARAYLDSLSTGIVLWGFPGEQLESYVCEIETLASANTTLSQFHTKRRQAIEAGEAPTVSESLEALGS